MAKNTKTQSSVETAPEAPKKRAPRKRKPVALPDAMKMVGNRWEFFRKFFVSKGLEPLNVRWSNTALDIVVTCAVKVPGIAEHSVQIEIHIKGCTLNGAPVPVPIGGVEAMPQPMAPY